MSFCIGNEYKTVWTKIKDLKNIKLNALPVYKNKDKIRTHMAIKFILTFVA